MILDKSSTYVVVSDVTLGPPNINSSLWDVQRNNYSTRILTIYPNQAYVVRISSSDPEQLPLLATVTRGGRPSLDYFFNHSIIFPTSLMFDGSHSFGSKLEKVQMPGQLDKLTRLQFPNGDLITIEGNSSSVIVTGWNYSPRDVRIFISVLPYLDYYDNNGTYEGEIGDYSIYGPLEVGNVTRNLTENPLRTELFVSSYATGCFFWNQSADEWQSEGCKV
jgi:hypothetical protein